MNQEDVANFIFEALRERFPNAQCELEYETPLDLLVATVLSAQCTDDRVNQVTRSLFAELRTPADYLNLGQHVLEEKIKSLGLFRTKAKNILALCRILIEEYGGEVPRDIEKLKELPGVGRKTANVVASNAFGIPALAVDTHVFRVARRLGLAKGNTPEKVEEELKSRFPRERWSKLHHLLIFHGRRVCTARKPDCKSCPVVRVCAAQAQTQVQA